MEAELAVQAQGSSGPWRFSQPIWVPRVCYQCTAVPVLLGNARGAIARRDDPHPSSLLLHCVRHKRIPGKGPGVRRGSTGNKGEPTPVHLPSTKMQDWYPGTAVTNYNKFKDHHAADANKGIGVVFGQLW
jgi:hypothetical protein